MKLPFPMLGLDVDNDSAFINETVVDYCKDRKHRADEIARLQEERSGMDRAEERLSGPAAGGIRPAGRRGGRCGTGRIA